MEARAEPFYVVHYEDAWRPWPVLRLMVWFGLPFALLMGAYGALIRGSVSPGLVVVIPAAVILFGLPMALLAWLTGPHARTLSSETRVAVIRAVRTGSAVSTEEEAVALLKYAAKFRHEQRGGGAGW
jgi:hypothetical protein